MFLASQFSKQSFIHACHCLVTKMNGCCMQSTGINQEAPSGNIHLKLWSLDHPDQGCSIWHILLSTWCTLNIWRDLLWARFEGAGHCVILRTYFKWLKWTGAAAGAWQWTWEHPLQMSIWGLNYCNHCNRVWAITASSVHNAVISAHWAEPGFTFGTYERSTPDIPSLLHF